MVGIQSIGDGVIVKFQAERGTFGDREVAVLRLEGLFQTVLTERDCLLAESEGRAHGLTEPIRV